MAIRRPKVPRAVPAAPGPPGTAEGGAVIRGDFGSPGVSGVSGASRTGRGTVPGTGAAGGKPPAGTPRAAQRRAGTGTAPAAPEPKAPPERRPAKPEESLDPVPAKAFSGRMLALAVVMVAISIMLAPTVKIFVDKRAEIAALQADIESKQSQQDDLKHQVSRWQDPHYVKQQARDRINMVMPGETGYWVFGSDLAAGAPSGAAGEKSAHDPAKPPWVDALWDSIRRSALD